MTFAKSVCAFAALASGVAAFGARPMPALRSVAEMNRDARLSLGVRTPGSATQVYPWSDGALFHLFTAPGIVSDIALEPGETLVSVAAGDTARWIVGDTTSGSASAKQVHILIKPNAVGLSTNLIVLTDRRAYHLEASSTSHVAMTEVRWTYPASALLSIKSTSAGGEAGQTKPDDVSATASEALNFDYVISGDHPSWRPLLAFDDGRQTFIKFPASLGSRDAPPLFVLGAKGEPQLVNYRVRGTVYVVDQLFDTAELRLGTKSQQVVRLARATVAADHQP